MRKSLPVALLAVALLLGACSASKNDSARSAGPPPAAGHGIGGNGAQAPEANAPGKAQRAGDDATPSSQFGPVVDAGQDPRSTFALDVDTASYSYARTLIQDGHAPEASAVRPEEFINSFAEDYPQPSGNGFSVSLDGSPLPGGHEVDSAAFMRLLRVGLRTRADAVGERPDASLTFVIDVSGSMGDPGKLDLVKDALHHLVEHLRPTDSVAIVTFNSEAHVLQSVTTIAHKSTVNSAIDRLRASGSTNLEAGLVSGYQVAREGSRSGDTNRVVLLSDGLANQGDTGATQILAQVREAADKQITLLGVGVGRDYGDALMEQLADQGDGFVVYVSDVARARELFAERLPATVALRALDAKAQVMFDPENVISYRLIGYDDRALADDSFRDDHVDGGEVTAGHTVTALYAIRLRPGAQGQVALADVRWLDPVTRAASEATDTISVTDLGSSFAQAAPLLQVCYAAAYFAEALRHSPYGGQVQLADLARIAAGAADRVDDPAVAELATTIRQAEKLR